MENSIFTRTKLLIGEQNLAKLRASNVLVVGVGGVGGYACEILVRAGVGNITIVDSDKVDITNINRQIIALNSTIGEYKTDVLSKRLLDINPELNIRALNMRYNAENSDIIYDRDYDYVIDAIDSVPDKLHLIVTAKAKGYNIISAMGAGNRYALGDFYITDIFKTSGDRLARKMRKLLRDKGISKLDVVCSDIPSMDTGSTTIGSISYMPPLCGIKLAGYVVNKLMQK